MDKYISATIKIVATLVAFLILYLVRDLVAYLLLSFILASAMHPAIDWLQKRKIPRVVGGIVVSILILIIFSLIIYFTIPPFIVEVQNFISSFPQNWQNFLLWLPKLETYIQNTPFGINVNDAINQSIQKLSQAVTHLISIVSGIFSKILNLALIIIIAFYIAVEERMDKKISSFFIAKDNLETKKIKEKISKYWQLAENRAGRWLQGYIFLGLTVGILIYASLSILNIKYALVLAVLAGVLEIIPVFGPIFSALLGFSLAFFDKGFITALWAIFAFFIIYQIENFIIRPLIMKNRVNLNPILSLIVLFIGDRIGGIIGMLVSIPLAAILIAFWKDIKTNK